MASDLSQINQKICLKCRIYSLSWTFHQLSGNHYTPTNLIENFNKHLKRTTHHKEQFPTEDSLGRFLVSQF
ncbi:transposase [Lactiplantibacillus plantarum]|uniref:transposase n=1 Tax=Lactiplantibacillus plantarum TaxID=1590 RepID=UPI00290564CF|nr:transposase [Lactiplantibacillus plantarum]